MDDWIVTENLQNGSGTIDWQEIMFNSYLFLQFLQFILNQSLQIKYTNVAGTAI